MTVEKYNTCGHFIQTNNDGNNDNENNDDHSNKKRRMEFKNRKKNVNHDYMGIATSFLDRPQ